MPASGKFLLDTNIVIALLEGDEALLSNLDQATKVFVPAIVFGELFFGVAKSSGLLRTQPNWNSLQ
jgi:tRNA(fMet)-specific endonuclease VapC